MGRGRRGNFGRQPLLSLEGLGMLGMQNGMTSPEIIEKEDGKVSLMVRVGD